MKRCIFTAEPCASCAISPILLLQRRSHHTALTRMTHRLHSFRWASVKSQTWCSPRSAEGSHLVMTHTGNTLKIWLLNNMGDVFYNVSQTIAPLVFQKRRLSHVVVVIQSPSTNVSSGCVCSQRIFISLTSLRRQTRGCSCTVIIFHRWQRGNTVRQGCTQTMWVWLFWDRYSQESLLGCEWFHSATRVSG